MDCSFTNNKGQFRLRACAIIVEDDCVLMAKMHMMIITMLLEVP